MMTRIDRQHKRERPRRISKRPPEALQLASCGLIDEVEQKLPTSTEDCPVEALRKTFEP